MTQARFDQNRIPSAIGVSSLDLETPTLIAVNPATGAVMVDGTSLYANLDDRYLLESNNLSDLVNAATARTNLGVAIGTDVQAWDAQLDDIAALTPTDSNFIVGDGTNWVAENGDTVRTSLGLIAGGAGDIWVEKAGDIMEGVLNSLSIIPTVDSASNLGSSDPLYFANAYVDKIYLKSTDWIDTSDSARLTFNQDQLVGVWTFTIDGESGEFQIKVEDRAGENYVQLTPYAGTPLEINTSSSLRPAIDSTTGSGDSTHYWANTYTDKLYLNATATLDGATAGRVAVTGDIQIADAGKILIGTGLDGEIYSSSDDLYIKNITSNKDIIFHGNDGGVDKEILRLDSSIPVVKISGTISCPGAGTLAQMFGSVTTAAGNYSVAVGHSADTGGTYSVSIGAYSQADGANDVAIGGQAVITSSYINGVAVGKGATVTGHNATAVGYGATAGVEGVAIGMEASSSGANAFAMGRGAVAAAHQVVFGSTVYYVDNFYLGKGVTSASPSALTIQTSGGLGTDIAGGALQLAGGRGTGDATGGPVIFKTSDPGASGAALQSLTEKARIDVAGILWTTNKIAFTQTDGNEYIDSLNDGYMDYRATTAHRFGDGTNQLLISGAGVVTLEGTAKRWLAVRPDLDYTVITAQGKPTQVVVGVFHGYSMPVYAAGEELFFNLNVPGRWDEASDIIVHVLVALSVAEDVGDYFKFQLSWEHLTEGDVIPATSHDVPVEQIVLTDRNTQYSTYELIFTLDYDVDDPDDIVNHDDLGMRLRRIDATNPDVSNEIIVIDYHVEFQVDKMFDAEAK